MNDSNLKSVLALMALGIASIPLVAQADTLPKSPNGYYRMMTKSDDSSQYMKVDGLCVSATTNQFMALRQEASDAVAILGYDSHGEVKSASINLGAADAGASQIIYSLSDPENGKAIGNLHYINPGALGDPATLAMTALSSVTMEGSKASCLMDAHIVYLGIAQDQRMIVTMDEAGALTLADIGTQGKAMARTFHGGYWASDKAGDVTFLFIDGDKLTTLKAKPSGTLEYPAWRTLSDMGRDNAASPDAYFSADMEKLGNPNNRIPYGLSLHFERLEICNHLAGETGDSAKRNAQLRESWNKFRCDGVESAQESYVTQYSKDPAILAMLKMLAPVF